MAGEEEAEIETTGRSVTCLVPSLLGWVLKGPLPSRCSKCSGAEMGDGVDVHPPCFRDTSR